MHDSFLLDFFSLTGAQHLIDLFVRFGFCFGCIGSFIISLFIYLFIFGCIGLRSGEQGLFFLAVCGLLIAVACLVVEHRL